MPNKYLVIAGLLFILALGMSGPRGFDGLGFAIAGGLALVASALSDWTIHHNDDGNRPNGRPQS